jgi:hypothetical protein
MHQCQLVHFSVVLGLLHIIIDIHPQAPCAISALAAGQQSDLPQFMLRIPHKAC